MPSVVFPEQIHRYRILSDLGQGSMGRVYLAQDPRIDRKIALKVFSPRRICEADEESELRERFLREARAAGRLQHPGIVTVYDADVDPASGEPYLAMEWVSGKTLRRLLKERGKLPILAAVDVAAQVARALDYAHRHDVVHRDVKPANLLIAADGQVKIADFGIAKVVSESLTLTGHVLGSPYYMAPEQVRAEVADGRVDLFALGAVLYEMLTGRLAFGGDSLANVTFKILSVDPRPPEIYNPNLPPTLRAVLDRALAKHPRDRYATGAEMARALREVADQLGGDGALLDPGERPPAGPLADATTRYLTRPSRPRSRLRRTAVWGIAAVVAATGIVLGLRHRELGRDSSAGSPDPAAMAPPVAAPALTEGAADGAATKSPRPVVVPELERQAAEPPPPEPPPPEPWAPEPQPPEPRAPEPQPSEPPPPEPAAPATEPAATATLEIVYESHLRVAAIAAWVDGERVFFERLEAGMLKRLFGKVFRSTLEIPEGLHTVEIHVSGISKELEARSAIRTRFSRDRPRTLRVKLNRPSSTLDLSWEESP